MPKNPANKEGPFLARSKGTLRFLGTISDYGTVTNEKVPVSDTRARIRGDVQSNFNAKLHAGPVDTSPDDVRPFMKVRNVNNR